MGKAASFNILASILIVLGIIFMLQNFGYITWVWLLWPILPLILGTGFCMLYFKTRKDLVMLGLGSFLVLNSLFFFYLNFTSWALMTYLWPVFIFLLGMTFLASYIASKNRVLIYLSVLLIAIGVSFILIFAVSTILWPTSLVLAGASFIIINFFDNRKHKDTKKGVNGGKKKK